MLRLSSPPWMLSPVSVSARAGKVPALGQTPLPMVQPSKPAGAGGAAAGLGAGVLTLAIAGVGVAFTYGIARESKSKLVKTTGYVLAGAGALVALVEAATVGLVIGKAASA